MSDPGSPLLAAALAVLAESATAAELDARFAERGVILREGLADELLGELAALGLVRRSRMQHGATRYVVTSLGRRSVDAGLTGETADRLAELEGLRTDLLSTIAHELRTPLTTIRTSAGLLLAPDSHPTEDQRRTLLEAIARNGERMQRLVGDILELSRFRTGQVALQLRRFGASGLADSTVALIAPLAEARHQHIDRDDTVAPEHGVYGDHRRLEQALLNLVSNAQKFTPDGGRVAVCTDERGDDTVWSVVDEGPGITAADQDRLFERFFVGRSDRSGPREGVGLGLPTALAIAQAHGGTIEVDSAPGSGSTFRLVVPTNGPADEP